MILCWLDVTCPFTLPHYQLPPSILAQLHCIMAKKALSECVKKAKQSQLKELKLEAVDTYQCKQSKLVHLQKGAHKIAEEYGIPTQYKTITNWYNGGQSIAAIHGDQQKLKPSEEQTLVNFPQVWKVTIFVQIWLSGCIHNSMLPHHFKNANKLFREWWGSLCTS